MVFMVDGALASRLGRVLLLQRRRAKEGLEDGLALHQVLGAVSAQPVALLSEERGERVVCLHEHELPLRDFSVERRERLGVWRRHLVEVVPP